MNSNDISFIYIVLSILTITILSYLYFYKSREGFCTCHSIADKRCPDPKNLTNLYNSGKLTESTNFAAKEGTPAPWKIAMPQDRYQH